MIGLIPTLGLAVLLNSGKNYAIINPESVSPTVYYLVNVLSFFLCWVLAANLISRFPLYKVFGALGMLAIAIAIEYSLDVNNNPITIPLIILFWLVVANLIAPQFFNRYRAIILSVYGLLISYHFIVFVSTPLYTITHREDFARFILIPLPFFAVLWAYEQWRWLKILQVDKANAELALLKSQINPHFFFNTLNNLYGLVVEKSEAAPAVVLKLSDMMRYTIYEGKEEFVLLKDEINYLENYIELHKIRYQKRVDISFTHEVQEGLKVAPLLFIILLENAFKHGVEKIRDGAFIHLHMESRGKYLAFRIENSFDQTAQRGPGGIGLDNLKQSMAHTYRNRHELSLREKESSYEVQLNLELL